MPTGACDASCHPAPPPLPGTPGGVSYANEPLHLPPGATVPHTGPVQPPVVPVPTPSSGCNGCGLLTSSPKP
ncbi:MAG TPA: hypothetical protein VGO86_06170 [Candidatus Dormibacteraeota bacterium]